MNRALREEICRVLSIAPERFGFVIGSGNPQPHSQIVVRIFDGPELRGVAKFPRTGSGAFFLRRECLVTRWLHIRCPEARALVPIIELRSAPRPGLLYGSGGKRVAVDEVIAWLRRFQKASARPADEAAVRCALITRDAVSKALPPETRERYETARNMLFAAAREGRAVTVLRHGDVSSGNILRGGVIDWVHFRRVSLPEYDTVYFALVQLGLFAAGEFRRPGVELEPRTLVRLVGEVAGPPLSSEAVRAAGLVLAAAEIAFQSLHRARIGLAYGDREAEVVNERLRRLVRGLAERYRTSAL